MGHRQVFGLVSCIIFTCRFLVNARLGIFTMCINSSVGGCNMQGTIKCKCQCYFSKIFAQPPHWTLEWMANVGSKCWLLPLQPRGSQEVQVKRSPSLTPLGSFVVLSVQFWIGSAWQTGGSSSYHPSFLFMAKLFPNIFHFFPWLKMWNESNESAKYSLNNITLCKLTGIITCFTK